MFDEYQPSPTLKCILCEVPLLHWQGKDGDCASFVWRQGVKAPISQSCDEECKTSPKKLNACRLPMGFLISTYDCAEHHPIFAWCESVGGVWQTCELLPYECVELDRYMRFITDVVRVKRLQIMKSRAEQSGDV